MAVSKVLSTVGIPCTAPSENYIIPPQSDRLNNNLSYVIKCFDIPVIDLNYIDKAETIRCISDACLNYGFFQVINHGKSTESSEIVAHQLIHCHSLDNFVQEYLPSLPPSFKVIHIPASHIRSISNHQNLNLHDVVSGSSLPLTDVQGSQLNDNSLDDHQYYSDIIKQLLGNIECECECKCECDGFFEVCIYITTAVHTDDHEPAAAASSSSSSSPNQQHVIIEINDTEENTTSSVGISSIFKELEMGKTAMGYVPSALVALLINAAAFPSLALYAVVIAFSVGLTLTWNGIMLRNHDLFKRFGSLAEQIGVVAVFMGFFGLVVSILPLALAWVPLLCGIFFMLPFIQRFLPSHFNLLKKTNPKRIATSRRSPLLPINNNC